MNKLLIKFLNSDEKNKSIYKNIIDTGDKYYKDLLLERFYNYIFKIHFISYIEKSIKLKSFEIKNKKKKVLDKELYILNDIDEEFKEEKINTIIDNSIDFLENISKEPDFKNVSINKSLIKALENITDRQRLIIFMYFIEDKEEKQIAKELNVSKQSVNKVKLVGLKNLKNYIGNEIDKESF